ncbi:MAG: hypothetical protein AAFR36_30775, partial [Bacteroidota bacterium]
DLVTIVATFTDTEAPIVTCAEFTATFEDCPVGLGPNTPSGDWFPIPANGIFRSAVGGSFVIDVDVNDCLSDNCSDLTELERTLLDSYSEDFVPNCRITLVNEIGIRDACGNVADEPIVVKITIENPSTTPPLISCPADLTVECGMSTEPEDTGFATATDDCGGPTITFEDSFDPGCSSSTGTITRTWTATGGCGNVSTCEQIITIADDTAPLFDLTCQVDETFTTGNGDSCPLDATISLSEGDELTVNDGWTVGGITIPSLSGCVSDNCTADNDLTIIVDDITITHISTCSRTITVTFLADDGCGNISDPFVCNYTFVDDTAPVFDLTCQIDAVFITEDGDVCPADATISLSEGDELTVNDGWTVGGNAIEPLNGCVNDNCIADNDLTIVVDDITVVDDGTCSRTITVTFLADDGCGNISDPFVCNYTFIDDTAPVFDLSCQVDAVFTTEEGDLCPADATISLSEGDELTVNDGWTVGGNAILPLSGCVSDNCTADSDLTITVDDITVVDDGTCSRTITVTFLADDGCGNISDPFVCNYTFIDDTAPVFDLACQIDAVFTTENGNVCPADATISLSEGDELTVNDGWTVGGIPILPLAGCVSDNCTADNDLTITVDDITVVDDGTCSRTITVTFLADDGCGNVSDPFVCNYTFLDDTGPVVNFNGIPDMGTYVVECDLPSTTWDPLIETADLTISDNCSDIDFAGITVELTQLYDGPCTNNLLTRWQQVWVVPDVCGNETTYTLFTEIIDTTPPGFTSVPDDLTVECDQNIPESDVEAFDSCSEIIFDFVETRTDGNCPYNYTLTRTWTATDGCGNANTATQVITVEDTTPPEIIFTEGYLSEYSPGDEVFVECSEYGNISLLIANSAAARDNCSGQVPT